MNKPADEMINSAIAIVGMAGRFPGASTLEQFWGNLCRGVESVTFFSDEELRASGIADELLANPSYVKAKAILPGTDLFDAALFNIAPRDAELIDPQQRLFLECCWQALEHAGYDPDKFPGLIGVYGGASPNNYVRNLQDNPALAGNASDIEIMLGNDKDYLTTRVSYKLNLRGPSVSVQTACSTSLVAVHLACQSLLNGEADINLAGGVGASFPEKEGHLHFARDMNSRDGHCRPFDADATGTVWGDGVGVVVLKRLADAMRDGDTIHAVIRGSSINNDGALKVGFTAPSIQGQTEVIRDALAVAGIKADSIDYVETHGTGTALGDPIEIAALTEAFRNDTSKNGFCAVGSVKSNVGHLNSAAGVTGLIKTVLALKNKKIPPSINFKQANPKIDFANSPFFVNTELRDWTSAGKPRRAGVSAFGFGGTNAHIVLEEAPNTDATVAPSSEEPHLLVLSAPTASRLEKLTRDVADFISHPSAVDLTPADIAHTYQQGRRAFAHRRAVVFRNVAEVREALTTNQIIFGGAGHTNTDIAFVFPGQGTQSVNMARRLYDAEPVFRRELDLCFQLLAKHSNLDYTSTLFPKSSETENAQARIRQTVYAQPILFSVEYALAKTWMAWGATPTALLGHSLGEYVAACLAGVFTLEDALALVYGRAQLINELPSGRMIAVARAAADVQPLLVENTAIAAVNAPTLCVVTGSVAAVDELESRLRKNKIASTPLDTSHAFHSSMMEPVADRFRALVARTPRNAPRIRFLSNVHGDWITPNDAVDPEYWARHLLQPVLFSQCVQALASEKNRLLLEIGPGNTLSTLVRQHPDAPPIFSSLGSVSPGTHEWDSLLTAVGQLWVRGVHIDWRMIRKGDARRRIPLPGCALERKRYWIGKQTHLPAIERTPSAVDRTDANERNIFISGWKLAPAGRAAKKTPMRGACLVFIDSSRHGRSLVNSLKRRGHSVVTVAPGSKLQRNGNSYRINPRAPDDYTRLLADLAKRDVVPSRILHLWSELPTATSRQKGARSKHSFYPGFYSLMFLAQALDKTMPGVSIDISVLTRNAHAVTGEETLDPFQALSLGPCNVIPTEFRNIACRNIDISTSTLNAGTIDAIVDDIEAMWVSPSHEIIVAHRGAHRWIPTFERAPISDVDAASILKPRGVYLITGGLGGVGLALAKFLAEKVKARLVLTTRSAFPARKKWPEWLTKHGEQDDVSRKITALQSLERMSAEVLVLQVDVTDAAAMRLAKRKLLRQFGKIDGIVHGAGISDDGLIALKSPSAAATVLAPKVNGTTILHKTFGDLPLDFFAVCSSLSSLVGVAGQVDYCAANCFLDAFVKRQRLTGQRNVVSINWDLWRDAGMAVDANVPKALAGEQEELLKRGLSTSEALRGFTLAISGTHANTIVTNRSELLFDDHPWAVLPSATAPPASASQPAVAPSDVEQRLSRIWSDIFKLPHVGKHDDFFQIGGHSLMAARLVEAVSKAFDVSLPLTCIFEAPTVEKLAARIDSVRRRQPSNNSELVTLASAGDQSPLFCVHPTGGQVFAYKPLADLVRRPVIGIQSRALSEPRREHKSLRAMARHYANLIQGHQQLGPYHIAGWSLGAALAHMVAEELEHQGHRVAFLGLFDPQLATCNPKDRIAPLMAGLTAIAGNDIFKLDASLRDALEKALRKTPSKKHRDVVASWLREHKLMQDVPGEFLDNQIALAEHHIRLLQKPKLGVVRAPCHLWLAKQLLTKQFQKIKWSDHLAGKIVFHVVDANHFTLLQTPQVEYIASTLANALAAPDREPN